MAKFTLRQEAIDDLTGIWNYTFEQWSEKQADKYYETIKSACNEVAKQPNLGKGYFEIAQNLLP